MIRKTLVVLALAVVALWYSAPAMADDLHLCDINQFTTCNAGSVISINSSQTQNWAFGNSATNENLYIAVLTPQSGGSQTFINANTNVSGTNLWQVLLGTAFQNFPNFASTASQEQGATGMVANSFVVTSFLVGTWNGSVTAGQSVVIPSQYMQTGNIFIAFLRDSSGNLIAVSPWSSSLIVGGGTSVPEPSSILLLGSGLLVLGGYARRRFLGN